MNAATESVRRQEVVALVHGLYMRGFCLALLARRLTQAGYRTVLFSYPSLHSTPAALVGLVRPVLARIDAPAAHWVGHSLGGLIIRQLLAHAPELPPGRVVTLGTPHQGCRIAQRLEQRGWRFMLGESCRLGLLGDAPPWTGERELGSIAGVLNVGLGRLFGPVEPPADGTVAAAETYLPGMKDHICLPVSHTGMLFSPLVARQTCAFLQTGKFIHAEN